MSPYHKQPRRRDGLHIRNRGLRWTPADHFFFSSPAFRAESSIELTPRLSELLCSEEIHPSQTGIRPISVPPTTLRKYPVELRKRSGAIWQYDGYRILYSRPERISVADCDDSIFNNKVACTFENKCNSLYSRQNRRSKNKQCFFFPVLDKSQNIANQLVGHRIGFVVPDKITLKPMAFCQRPGRVRAGREPESEGGFDGHRGHVHCVETENGLAKLEFECGEGCQQVIKMIISVTIYTTRNGLLTIALFMIGRINSSTSNAFARF